MVLLDFASLQVLPVPDEDSVEIDEKHLSFQFMRSSGRGGQRRDKVETAVLVKHLPTGVTAFCEKVTFLFGFFQTRKIARLLL